MVTYEEYGDQFQQSKETAYLGKSCEQLVRVTVVLVYLLVEYQWISNIIFISSQYSWLKSHMFLMQQIRRTRCIECRFGENVVLIIVLYQLKRVKEILSYVHLLISRRIHLSESSCWNRGAVQCFPKSKSVWSPINIERDSWVNLRIYSRFKE